MIFLDLLNSSFTTTIILYFMKLSCFVYLSISFITWGQQLGDRTLALMPLMPRNLFSSQSTVLKLNNNFSLICKYAFTLYKLMRKTETRNSLCNPNSFPLFLLSLSQGFNSPQISVAEYAELRVFFLL